MAVVNPRSEPDPRYDPADDLGNALAHGEVEALDPAPETDVQSLVARMIEEAVRHYEEHLEPDQVQATKYYRGEPFGDEEEGRSKVVSTDVRDATQAQLPSLMRIFFGPEKVVEFRARGPEDEPVARQATEYVNYIVTEDNPGFLALHSAFKDALVRRLGIIKWWVEETKTPTAERYEGLTEQQLALLMNDPDVDVDVTAIVPDAMFGSLFHATVTRYESDSRFRIAAVPPEEFVYTPDARSLEEAPLVAHVREVPAGDLIAMGIDPEIVEEAKGRKSAVGGELADVRHYHSGRFSEETERDESQKLVVYAEAYALVDGDGDGIAERRLFQCVGPDYRIVNGDGLGEIVDEIPFALFTPDPEPHTIVGLSNYDYLKDVQRVKSQIQRGLLDSLALALQPDIEVVSGEVNMQDVLSPEVGKIIRVTRPGMMREISHEFLGASALAVLGYWDEVKENRTGISKAAAGLDADSLQSATKAAVAATLSGAQQHIEMIARVFAETGMKRLYRGLLKLIVRHQNRARVIRLRGQYVEVDPRSWDATMDVSVNVALGQGTPEERIQTLMGILMAQRELMAAGSPLVSNVELRNTLGRLVELSGWKNSDEFFRPWGPEEESMMQEQLAQQPPPPDPATMLAQIEQLKVQMQAMVEQQKLELERWKALIQDDRERDKMARDAALKEFEIERKYQAKIDDANLRAKVAQDRAEMAEIP